MSNDPGYSPGSAASMPSAGHTDENGVFHWGTAADRAERIARDNTSPPQPEIQPDAAADAARALWENATPSPEIERNGLQIERERER
ncbi:hypothetical protein CNY89_04440 [Amaricoccus sp. HAR-UPW-R2A-40]|nr:hypothetical protein CNY89_04440 [Amaricoccus sp. HAR-UPW-R2A-40]